MPCSPRRRAAARVDHGAAAIAAQAHPARARPGPRPGRGPRLGAGRASAPLCCPRWSAQIRADTGVIVTREDWQLDQVPSHLRPRFVVEDDEHRALASGRDLHVLRQEQAAPVREVLAEAVGQLERSGVRTWDFGPLPRSVRATHNGAEVVGYPSLVDEAGTVAVRVLASAGEQQVAMRAGTVRLLRLTVASPVRAVLGPLDARDQAGARRQPRRHPDRPGRGLRRRRDGRSRRCQAGGWPGTPTASPGWSTPSGPVWCRGSPRRCATFGPCSTPTGSWTTTCPVTSPPGSVRPRTTCVGSEKPCCTRDSSPAMGADGCPIWPVTSRR